MEAQQTFGDDVRFIGVPSLSDEEAIAKFVAERGVSGFEHIPDIEGELWDRFDVSEHRTYILINDDGAVEKAGYGSLDEDVRALIAR